MSEQMLRYNAGKVPLSLTPTAFVRALTFDGDYYSYNRRLITAVAKVLDFGAKKYSANNWRKGGSWLMVVDCALRHLMKVRAGEQYDDESGLHHLAHAACNIAFLLEFVDQKTGTDDRYHLAELWPLNGDNTGSGLSEVIELLLFWKDGGDASWLKAAALHLAEYFETLPDPDTKVVN